jgi:hypothetical protein
MPEEKVTGYEKLQEAVRDGVGWEVSKSSDELKDEGGYLPRFGGESGTV